MRTTLIIDRQLFRELKRIAAEQGRTLSDITQETLRRGLAGQRRRQPGSPPRLRTFAMGRPRVDLADRDQLFDVLDRR